MVESAAMRLKIDDNGEIRKATSTKNLNLKIIIYAFQ